MYARLISAPGVARGGGSSADRHVERVAGIGGANGDSAGQQTQAESKLEQMRANCRRHRGSGDTAGACILLLQKDLVLKNLRRLVFVAY